MSILPDPKICLEPDDLPEIRLEPKKRPHYLLYERLEILLIQATRGLTNVKITKRFQATFQTIRHWIQGKNKEETIVQIVEKLTRDPDSVWYIVQ